MKFILFLFVFICVARATDEIAEESWKIVDGTLYINDTMADFETDDDQPWEEYKDDIVTVFVANIDTIGANWFANMPNITHVEIANGVKHIKSGAFKNCSNLESIDLSSHLETIEKEAFMDCPKLVIDILPKHIVSIAEAAFKNCESLENVTLPLNLTIVEKEVFMGCTGLKTIKLKSNITHIYDSAFAGCSQLASIKFPKHLKAIGSESFAECKELKTVVFNNELSIIGKGSFRKCSSLEHLILPDSLEIISDEAFKHSGINTVEYKDRVIQLGKDVFKGPFISKLILHVDDHMTVYNSSETKLWNEFRFQVEHLIIKGNASDISANAFEQMDMLFDVQLPNTVKTVGSKAFFNCSILKTITLPSSVEKIEEDAFSNCPTFEYVYFLGQKEPQCAPSSFALTNVKRVQVDQSYSNYTFCSFPIIIECGPIAECLINATENKLYVLGSGNMTNVSFSDFIRKNIVSIKIDDGIYNIAPTVFHNFTALEVVIIGRLVDNFEVVSFKGCNNLTEFVTPSMNPKYNSKDGILYNEQYTKIVKYPPGKQEVMFKISTPVETIAMNCFSYNNYLQHIEIYADITQIEKGAFSHCDHLSKIVYVSNTVPTCSENIFEATPLISVDVPVFYPFNETFCGQKIHSPNRTETTPAWKIIVIVISIVVGFGILVTLSFGASLLVPIIKKKYRIKKNKKYKTMQEDVDDDFVPN